MHLKRRSLIGVFLLSCVTLSLYQIYWFFITKTEMNVLNSRNNKVPFFLWFFIPIVNIWWYYRFCKGMEAVTKGNLNKWLAFFAPVIIGFMVAVLFAFIGSLSLTATTLNPSSLLAYGIAILVSVLPVLYYQSYLNKVAK